MKIRIDPVDENGAFDNDIYSREDYEEIKKSITRYLTLEGFTETTGEYFISLLDQSWHVYIK